jgi:cell division protein FtsW
VPSLPGLAGRGTPESTILGVTTGVLLVLGLVMTFSASFVASAAESGDAFAIFRQQLLWAGIGLGPMLVLAFTDYRRWRVLATPLMVVSLAAAIAVLVPGIGDSVNGARRWIDLGPANFQPTELLKLAVPVYLAHVLGKRPRRLAAGDVHGLFMPAAPLLIIVGLAVMAEPDLETAVLLLAIGGVVLYAAGLPGRIITAGGGLVAALVTAGIATSAFRRQRVAAWLDPMAYADSIGFQAVQGYIALGSGGWFGVGLGQSRGKWLYVPNAHTDFIYAIIGEELGLVGALFVLALYVALAVGGVRTAHRAPDLFGRLLAAGITGWLALQATINMGSVVGLLPVTGVTLPLVSFGGSSLVFTMLGLGVLISIARAGQRPEPETEPAPE